MSNKVDDNQSIDESINENSKNGNSKEGSVVDSENEIVSSWVSSLSLIFITILIIDRKRTKNQKE